MRDLTQGSIAGHLIGMASFIGISLIFQTLYFIVDLYFVSRLGNAALAGVSAAGNIFFLALAAAQLVSIGALALVSQAVGRRNDADANLYADQALSMSILFAVLMLVLGYTVGGPAIDAVTADAASAEQGRAFFFAYVPALALMFPSYTMTSSLRGAGVVAPTTVLQVVGLILNAVLAPVLIAGWGTGVALGTAGAGLASSIVAAIGIIALVIMFPRVQTYLRLHISTLAPRWHAWRRILFIGLPTAFEFALMFVIIGVVYWAIRGFGAEAQAGYGITARIMQSIFLPAMAITFAAAPVAGQNFGAGRHDRVRETFKQAALMGSALMLIGTLICQIRPDWLIRPFADDPAVLAIGVEYLRIASCAFVLNGLIMTCGSLFQGMGDTRPSLIASASRLITFVAPAVWLSSLSGVKLTDFWYVSIASIVLQCALALYLLSRMFKQKLGAGQAPLTAAAD
jgi:putative MATE family efflux protein